VALKILSKYHYEKRGEVYRAFHEKRFLQRCRSPFTVKCFGIFKTSNFVGFALEHVQGYELFDFIQESEAGLSVSLTRFLAAQVILFLETLHRKNILYRDLKPENIMVLPDAYIKIVDFGLCAELDENKKRLNPSGTPSYFCPEKVQHQSYDEKSDIWSLGVLLYEMVTTELLFKAATREESLALMKRYDKESIPFPESSPAWKSEPLRELIQSILRFHPRDRPSLDEIKSHPFFREVKWSKLSNQHIQIRSQSWCELFEQTQTSVLQTRKEKMTANVSGSSSRSRRSQRSKTRSRRKSAWRNW
jgi:serine/threonine protein kinase